MGGEKLVEQGRVPVTSPPAARVRRGKIIGRAGGPEELVTLAMKKGEWTK